MLKPAFFIGLVATSTLAVCLSAKAQLPSGAWQYYWGDDFSGDTLDATKWSVNYPWGTTHNHDAVMSPTAVAVGDGALTLTARRTGGGTDFTSGAISTGYNRVTFNGGYIEARILLPDTPGSWPAFWGLYDGWPPENDIMEYPIDTVAGSGYAQDQYHTAFHYRNSSGGNSAGAGQVNPGSAGDLGGAYHTFGMEWREDDWVGYYFDGALVQQFGDNTAIAQMERMYLILNYAVGGWPGTPNTSEWPVGHTDEMKVDWVRVWKQAGSRNSDWTYAGAEEYVQWDTAANWTNAAPNLGGVTSSFDTVNGVAQQRLDWTGRRTLSVIQLNGDTRYRFGFAGDRLALGWGDNGGISPTINIASTTTTEHEVAADLELAGGLQVNNDSAYPLLLTGSVLGGAGAVRINGPGVVSFDGVNAYTADTFVDSGGQGPGVARARGQNAFGIGGRVIIAQAGNASTGRVELENNSLVSNNIGLRGRNNASAAIVNNSGDNTISGTLNLEVGGVSYLVRSDAGVLNLSGDATQAGGVAVTTSTNMGARTLTLDGAGDGRVQGAIRNSSGTTLNLFKTGAGQWTLDSDNDYSGATTINEGTLVVNGSTGAGPTTVAAGAMLSGGGMVRGALLANAGATVRVGGAALPYVFRHTVIDDFEGYTLGTVRDVASPPWTAHENTGFAAIESDAGNQVLTYGWAGNFRGSSRTLDSTVDVDQGDTATYFFRFNSKTATPDHNFGIGDQATTASVDFSDFEAQVRLRADSTDGVFALDARDGGGFSPTLASGLGVGAWYNTWLVVDNATNTYDIYMNTGDADATPAQKLNSTPLAFRNGTTSPLDTVLALSGPANIDLGVRIDDLAYTSGFDLSNPLSAVAQVAGETLTVAGDFTLAENSVLEIDLAATTHDSIAVSGSATLSGTLVVTLEAGFTPAPGVQFTVLSAGALTNNLTLGGPDAANFSLASSPVGELLLNYTPGLACDFNGDGVVNLADYTVWRDNLGAPAGTLMNDTVGGVIGTAQYNAWRANLGAAMPAGAWAGRSVPEPTTIALLALAVCSATTIRPRPKLLVRFHILGLSPPRRTTLPYTACQSQAGQ